MHCTSIFVGISETEKHPYLCCIAHENKKCGTDYNVKCIWNRGLVKIGPLNFFWVVQHLCALSLAACPPLKPPKDTTRPDELNQVTI